VERYCYVKITTNDDSGTPLELRFTNSVTRYKNQDPSLASAPFVEWEPRLRSVPTVSQSVTSFVKAKISVSTSNISIVNSDQAYTYLVTDDFAWLNSTIEIWFEDNIGTPILVFTGVISSPKMTGQNIVFSAKSNIELLKQPAFFGDSESECIIDSTTHPNVANNLIGLSVPYVIGPFGKVGVRDENFIYVSGNEKEMFGRAFAESGLFGILVDGPTDEYIICRVPLLTNVTSINQSSTPISSGLSSTNRRAVLVSDASGYAHGDEVLCRFSGSGNDNGYIFYIDYSKNLMHIINTDIVNNPTPTNFPVANLDLIISRTGGARLGYNISSTDNVYGSLNNQRSTIMVSRAGTSTATT